MDVVTASFLVLGAVGAGGVVLHYLGYIPRPYRERLERTEATLERLLTNLPPAMGIEVENALNRVAEAQEAKYAEGAKAALKSAEMSGVRQIGLEKQQMKELQGLMVEGIGGPVFKAIEAWNPDWADKLRAVPPDLLLQFLESPWFQRNILPRIQPFLQQFMGRQGGEESSGKNPFLTE